jgi:hypothetical protein
MAGSINAPFKGRIARPIISVRQIWLATRPVHTVGQTRSFGDVRGMSAPEVPMGEIFKGVLPLDGDAGRLGFAHRLPDHLSTCGNPCSEPGQH